MQTYKCGENNVVVVSVEFEILLKPSQSGIAWEIKVRCKIRRMPDGILQVLTDVGSINEAKKIQQGNGGHDVEVNLPPKPSLRLGIESDKGVAISAIHGSAQC